MAEAEVDPSGQCHLEDVNHVRTIRTVGMLASSGTGWRWAPGPGWPRKLQRPPPDCRRIVIRLRSGIERRSDRRATSTGQSAWL